MQQSLILDQGGPAGLRTWLSALTIGAPQRVGELTLVPLLHSRVVQQADILIEEAISQGQLDIVEQGSAAVQQVLARNRGDSDVLVLEGDTLIGCKQNRMVAWSVLVGARTTAPVSVGCMERGRWGRAGPAFMPGEMMVDPHIRRRSKRETSASVARLGGPRLDQNRAWRDVNCKLREWKISSGTDDYHAGLLARIADTRARLRHIKPAAAQVGVIALHQDRLLGLEAVAHPKTWDVLARRALPAYTLGAESARLDPEFRTLRGQSPGEWLAAIVKGASTARLARGRGYDIVITADGVTGSCLWHEGAARHVTAFAA